MKKRIFWFASLIVLMGLVLNPQKVFAHEDVTVGDYDFEIGWIEEPPIAGQQNAILVNVVKCERRRTTTSRGCFIVDCHRFLRRTEKGANTPTSGRRYGGGIYGSYSAYYCWTIYGHLGGQVRRHRYKCRSGTGGSKPCRYTSIP